MALLLAALSGLIFGLGLLLSGMTNPAKVQGFLDLGGAWDPSLGLVMVGAIAVAAVAFARARGRSRAWTGVAMEIPQRKTLDKGLIVGGLLFGTGWGLAGFCPGPALVALSSGMVEAWIFVPAMLLGMFLPDGLFKPRP
ncbi:putative membrane protein YedE/YeeE [Paucibacter oligotrophus]|uniref:Putative membrane protein YedE/YeeE n=1 Tax=Roseateles oligotrophus TaxID=1769250 RepID=A0A840LHW7_9BURK|nr:DUF6691 family protein [Roseateles oligotrophus]MBB4844857.1 putative membrane protein YedE/YeeE [Roseateles oligotrophus]